MGPYGWRVSRDHLAPRGATNGGQWHHGPGAADSRPLAAAPTWVPWLLLAGFAILGAVGALCGQQFLGKTGLLRFPVDLNVYRDAGLIVRQVRPFYDPHRLSPLYNWPGPPGHRGLLFAYTPFAALPFALMSYLPLQTLGALFRLADLAAVPAVIWITFGALDVPNGSRRVGLTALATGVAVVTEPVWRTLSLGQIEILLMLLIVWDLYQPDRRSWKGAGVGIAAGIKLVPLIFIPYLLLTRRFRQAAVAAATFAATLVIGFIVLPRDSSRWWLHGLFLRGSYLGTNRYAGNQSLLAIFMRADNPAWHAEWTVAAAVTGVLGLAIAALLDRAGHSMLGFAACVLTGLLVSPISWDHHWVWIVVVAPLALYYGLEARGLARWAWFGLGALVLGLFGAWPTWLWGETAATDPYGWGWGLIWAPPNGRNRELGWHGLQLIVGNTYVISGLALFAVLAATAVTLARRSGARDLATPLAGAAAEPELAKQRNRAGWQPRPTGNGVLPSADDLDRPPAWLASVSEPEQLRAIRVHARKRDQPELASKPGRVEELREPHPAQQKRPRHRATGLSSGSGEPMTTAWPDSSAAGELIRAYVCEHDRC
jgi:alpha-1,2-mannosyltransferase